MNALENMITIQPQQKIYGTVGVCAGESRSGRRMVRVGRGCILPALKGVFPLQLVKVGTMHLTHPAMAKILWGAELKKIIPHCTSAED